MNLGLRALSPDPQAWDRVDAALGRYMALEATNEVADGQPLDYPIELGL
jgi:hypothetical protein